MHQYQTQKFGFPQIPTKDLAKHIGEVLMFNDAEDNDEIKYGILTDVRKGVAYFSHIQWRWIGDPKFRIFTKNSLDADINSFESLILTAYNPLEYKMENLLHRLRNR